VGERSISRVLPNTCTLLLAKKSVFPVESAETIACFQKLHTLHDSLMLGFSMLTFHIACCKTAGTNYVLSWLWPAFLQLVPLMSVAILRREKSYFIYIDYVMLESKNNEAKILNTNTEGGYWIIKVMQPALFMGWAGCIPSSRGY
jgi:glucan phosphoethanolaminetransferase (alkaline phosphatase superfamily)